MMDLPPEHGPFVGDDAAIEAPRADSEAAGHGAALERQLARALERLWIAFQPIVHWSARAVFGYEALVRSHEPSLSGPGALFDAARRLGRLHDLGRAIRRQVAAELPRAPYDTDIFVNVEAGELNDNELISAAAPLTAFADRVVLEITERSSLHEVSGLSTRLARLRALGFRLALDDLGAGYAGLNSLWELEPTFVKLDAALIRGVDRFVRKRSLVQGLARILGRDLGVHVICEGVETRGERDALELDGLSLLQGFLFARPQSGFVVPTW